MTIHFYMHGQKYFVFLPVYLTGGSSYQIIVLIFIFIGSISNISIVWELADMVNGLMVIPNIIGILFLINEVKDLEKDYTEQLKVGELLEYDYKYR